MRVIVDWLAGFYRQTKLLSMGNATGSAMAVMVPDLFMREILRNPQGVGALRPSSTKLARAMVAQVPISGSGLVVELGAGTGVITEALLARGIHPERLLIVECSAAFVSHLRQRFPQLKVVHGDAACLQQLAGYQPVDVIVSGLPLRSLPENQVAAIVSQWQRTLSVGGQVLQFTYALRRRSLKVMAGFCIKHTQRVWANMPPATIVSYQRKHDD